MFVFVCVVPDLGVDLRKCLLFLRHDSVDIHEVSRLGGVV